MRIISICLSDSVADKLSELAKNSNSTQSKIAEKYLKLGFSTTKKPSKNGGHLVQDEMQRPLSPKDVAWMKKVNRVFNGAMRPTAGGRVKRVSKSHKAS